MKHIHLLLGIPFIISVLSLAGCNMPPPSPKLTSLQIQAMQTREFATSKKVAFNAVMSVFQDLGYNIESASLETGFINAESPSQTVNAPNFDIFSDGQGSTTTNTITATKATAFVSQVGKKAKIRLNFVTSSKTSTSSGQLGENDNQVLNADTYQNAFNQIRQQIFVSTGLDKN